MPFIKVSNINVNYRLSSEKLDFNDKGLFPTLLVHGAGGSSYHWLPLLFQLNSSILPLALDLPGHGCTSGTVLDSIEAAANFIANFLDVLNIRKPICYVGQSLGGLIGLQFALSYPQKVKQLVLMTTAPKIQLHPDFLSSALSGKWDLEDLQQSFAPKIPESLKTLVLNEFKHTRLSKNASDFMGVSQVDLSDAIKTLKVPTMILTGDDDVIISPRKGKLLHKLIPNSRLVNISEAGHYLQVEQPSKVADEILAFLLSTSVEN